MITIVRLARIMPNAGDALIKWLGPLEQAMAAFEILTAPRMAMFLANVAHESRELTALEEDLRYRAAGLRKIFPRHFSDDAIAEKYAAWGPVAIANRVYADRMGNGPESSGDGWKFRGRGPIGVTGKYNYGRRSTAILGDETTLLEHPEFLCDPEFGAAAAAEHWATNGCNTIADRGDFDGACDVINLGRKTLAIGDSIGFADRVSYYKRAIAAFT